MKTRQKLLSSALFMACGVFASQAQAALPVDPVLNFTPCVVNSATTYCNATGGSWFGMDTNGNSIIGAAERTSISSFRGVRISTATLHNSDATQAASGSHSGLPNGSESPNLDNAWGFFKNTGLHQTTSPVTVVSDDATGNVVLTFSGWNVTWNGIASIKIFFTT